VGKISFPESEASAIEKRLEGKKMELPEGGKKKGLIYEDPRPGRRTANTRTSPSRVSRAGRTTGLNAG